MLKIAALGLGVMTVVAISFVIDSNSRLIARSSAPLSQPRAVEVHAPGRVEGSTEEIDLRARLFGRVEEVSVREGQLVEKGEVLLRIDAAQEKWQRAAAEAELATAEAELDRIVNGARAEERREAAANVRALAARLDSARQRLARNAKLRERGAVTAQELDDLTAEAKTLESEVEAARARWELLEAPARDEDVRRATALVAAAKARLELANDQYERAVVRAPRAAQVLRVAFHEGELTGPDSEEPALILADTSRLYVRAYVDEFDAPRIRVGMKAKVTAEGSSQVVHGQITRLSPRMTQKPLRTDDPLERFDTKAREVWIELDETSNAELVVGLPVDVVLGASYVERRRENGEEAKRPGRSIERGQFERENQQ